MTNVTLADNLFILNNLSNFIIKLIMYIVFSVILYKLLRNIMNFTMQDKAGCQNICNGVLW
jgi:ABC-type enterochelin transport system permease subunit